MTILDNEHLSMLSKYVLCSWQSRKVEVQKETHLYWSSRDEIAIIDGTAMKGE